MTNHRVNFTRSRHAESPAVLRDSLGRRLVAYAASAGSAAAGLMLGAPQASAQIVYTPVHKTINCDLSACSRSIFIDLNHDGVQDFQLNVNYLTQENWDEMAVHGNHAEQADIVQNYCGSAVVLRFGGRIGRAGEYFRTKAFMAVNCRSASNRCSTVWENQTEKYLGLKFNLADGVHWGWAELTTETTTGSMAVHLVGYAYETVPGDKIRAGQLGDDISGTLPIAGSLGALALGWQGVGSVRLKSPETSGGE